MTVRDDGKSDRLQINGNPPCIRQRRGNRFGDGAMARISLQRPADMPQPDLDNHITASTPDAAHAVRSPSDPRQQVETAAEDQF
jgi:hypothetical protein